MKPLKIFTTLSLLGAIFLSGCVEVKDKEEAEAPMKTYSISEDVIWNEPMTLQKAEVIKARRLIIKRKAVINTLDFPLIIDVEELIAEDGTIQNFPKDAQASWEGQGRSGGTINITAKAATGNLNIFLRGERGGNGKNGQITDPRRHPGCAGTNGGDGGNTGDLFLQIDSEFGGGFLPRVNSEGGLAGPRGIRGSVASGSPLEESVAAPCFRDAPDGVDGKPGREGTVCIKRLWKGEQNCD
ncbi:hypothetical protein B9G69_007185 [Bdellovibrio sp. SKB1291214]|uniref:hypothetical protein n=1 Tax=Bdellovibrio sp. SKB1291214 TaxID=1732569 RepID=UPI000B51C70C|nr:hypothetical protein [Bdellovibrio sp. SKB1291214]UYL10362.1 hypothetical protein B9G69_007185 [Bdellovibrio sp. SKB1291214]